MTLETIMRFLWALLVVAVAGTAHALCRDEWITTPDGLCVVPRGGGTHNISVEYKAPETNKSSSSSSSSSSGIISMCGLCTPRHTCINGFCYVVQGVTASQPAGADSTSTSNAGKTLRGCPCPAGSTCTPGGLCRADLGGSPWPPEGECPEGSLRTVDDMCVVEQEDEARRCIKCPPGTTCGHGWCWMLDVSGGDDQSAPTLASCPCPSGFTCSPGGLCRANGKAPAAKVARTTPKPNPTVHCLPDQLDECPCSQAAQGCMACELAAANEPGPCLKCAAPLVLKDGACVPRSECDGFVLGRAWCLTSATCTRRRVVAPALPERTHCRCPRACRSCDLSATGAVCSACKPGFVLTDAGKCRRSS